MASSPQLRTASRRSSFTDTLLSTATAAATAATSVGESFISTACNTKARIKTLKKRNSNKRSRSESLLRLLPDAATPPPHSIRRTFSNDSQSTFNSITSSSQVAVNEERSVSIEKETSIVVTKIENKKKEEKSIVDGDPCLICMEPFSRKQPPIRIPCTKQCNRAPVHAKCIYEWRECQPSKGVGSCPLCRSPMNRVSYLPPDIIKSARFVNFKPRRHFLVHPVPREAGVIRCYIRAVRSGYFSTMSYELYLQAPTTLKYPLGPLPDTKSGPREGDRLLAVAHKRITTWGCAQLDMSMDPTSTGFEGCTNASYLGCVESSFSGLEHSILAPHRHKNGKVSMRELGSVRYTQNRIRSTVGPRRVQVCLPSIGKVYDDGDDGSIDNSTDNAPVIIPQPVCNVGDWETTTESDEFFGEDDIDSPEPENIVEEEEEEDSDSEEVVKSNGRWATKIYKSCRKETLSNLLKLGADNDTANANNVMFARNKEPYWLDAIQAYSLDFQGRVTLPSNKNFQLLMENTPEVEDSCGPNHNVGNKQYDIALQFGKVGDTQSVEMYTMDVQWPLSPVQAFGICLSACDRKLLCS